MKDTDQEVSVFDRIAAWATHPELAFSETALCQTRLCIVDTLACMYAGAKQPTVRQAAGAMCESGAKGTISTILRDVYLSGSAAALVNGTAAHVLDYDDYEAPASTHPSAVLIPALMALNELKPSSYGQVIKAYLVGFEAIIRMGQALGGYKHYMAGWHATSTIGTIGASAACARFLDLPVEKFLMAMAIACSQSSGLKRQFGSETKPLHAGFAARSGLEAAQLAHAGINAMPDILNGPYGFIECYNGDPEANPETDFPTDVGQCAMDTYGVLRKPWPSCAYTHRIIEAALNQANKPKFNTKDIVKGKIRMPEPYFRVSPYLDPKAPPEARFSVLFCASSALTDGALSPSSFSNEAINRPQVRDLMSRIEIDAFDTGPELEDMSPDFPDSLTLHFKDGREITETVSQVKGGINNPLSESDIREKFLLCGGQQQVLDHLLASELDQPFDAPLTS